MEYRQKEPSIGDREGGEKQFYSLGLKLIGQY